MWQPVTNHEEAWEYLQEGLLYYYFIDTMKQYNKRAWSRKKWDSLPLWFRSYRPNYICIEE